MHAMPPRAGLAPPLRSGAILAGRCRAALADLAAAEADRAVLWLPVFMAAGVLLTMRFASSLPRGPGPLLPRPRWRVLSD